eukprot:5163785-Pyramimonas_sp.AAC.1
MPRQRAMSRFVGPPLFLPQVGPVRAASGALARGPGISRRAAGGSQQVRYSPSALHYSQSAYSQAFARA